MALVEVRPIERERWHGLKANNTFTRPKVIEALLSLNTGMYATGLTPEDRKRLEKLTGYDLSPEYVPGRPHPFWNSKTARVVLENKTNVFNTSRPLDEIKVKLLKASDLVANSQKEYEDGLFPYATFVIYDEREEEEIKASKLALKNKVVIESQKLTTDRKAEIIQILSGLSVRNQSANYLDLKLDEAINQHGAEKVLDLINRDAKRTTLHALVLEALHKNILRKEGSSIYYMEDQLGFDMESTLNYFEDKKNQALKAQILEKVNS